ncbi:MAG: hypothetical protein U0547_05400 [Dehalococcoidia bacterium]
MRRLPRAGGRMTAVLAVAVAMSISWRMGSGGAVFSDKGAQAYQFAADTLDAPTNLQAIGGSSVSLTWTASADAYASGYQVSRGSSSDGPFTPVAKVTSRATTSYTDSPGAGQWWYVVRAYRQNWMSADSTAAGAVVGTAIGFLHNNPSPATAGTASQAVLPIDLNAPTASTLYNYDTNRDTSAGLTLVRSSAGIAETDARRMQVWRLAPIGVPMTFSGAAQVVLYSAVEGFAQGVEGSITVAVRDVAPNGTATTVTSATLMRTDWQQGTKGFVQDGVLLPTFTHTFAADHQIEIKVVVNSTAADVMWFAYDTAAYPARVIGP